MCIAFCYENRIRKDDFGDLGVCIRIISKLVLHYISIYEVAEDRV
jgi:hypothetical protein